MTRLITLHEVDGVFTARCGRCPWVSSSFAEMPDAEDAGWDHTCAAAGAHNN